MAIEYNPGYALQDRLIQAIDNVYSSFIKAGAEVAPCRELRLPVAFDHPRLQGAVSRYMKTQRSTATYLPDNISFTQSSNGLPQREDIFRILTQTKFLVVAVGFISGLPLLMPLDPMSTLTAPKYNPSRILTPRGTIGLGGSSFCIYPADQPGGYMLLATTLPVWDTFGTKPGFSPEKPWLLEPFDIVSFNQVAIEEFNMLEADFDSGNYEMDIKHTTFDGGEYGANFLTACGTRDYADFRKRQQESIKASTELEMTMYDEWLKSQNAGKTDCADYRDFSTLLSREKMAAPLSAKVLQVHAKRGQKIRQNEIVVILEAMKMEIEVRAEQEHDGGTVDFVVEEGDMLESQQILATLKYV